MPPAISDNEASDAEITTPATSSRKQTREKKPTAFKEPEPEVEDEDIDEAAQNGDAGEDEDEEDGEEDEDVYVVEKILDHMIDPEGTPRFLVKWEGYEKKSDQTWEPEETLLEGAQEILKKYYVSIGGKEKVYEDTKKALNSKKRGRKSTASAGGDATPQQTQKRSRKNGSHPRDSEEPLTSRQAAWKPPAGSWEDHIAQLDACEDEETGKLMVYLTWKNGHKTQHETQVIYQRCPQKMLQFYERHVRIIKRDADAESVTNSQ